MIDIRKILEAGQAALDAKHAEGEAGKAGIYRVGSAGVVGTDGQIYGSCHRIAMLRAAGIDKEIEQSQKIMFLAGEANEEYVWARRLRAGYPDGQILAHDQMLVDHELPNGKRVMGHPDLGIADKDGKLLMGIENKTVMGYTTAISVFFEGKPKNENLVQAAAYSMFLGGVDYALCYTQFGWMPVNFYDQKRYNVKQIKPFDRMFYLRWVDGQLEYRNELEPVWVKTQVSQQGIIDYYVMLSEMQESKQLGPRPNSNYLDGTAHKWGIESNCKYCEFADACSRYDVDKDFDKWLEAAKQTTGDSDE